MGLLGIDPLRVLHIRDEIELAALSKIRDKMVEQKMLWDENLANQIANAVGKLFK